MDESDLLLDKSGGRLNAAKTLFDKGYYEDAISRAYYSMFLAAKALLKTRGVEAKTHRGVISKFGQEFVEKETIEKEHGKALHEAEELREEADYSTFRRISKVEAKAVIEDAGRFLARIKEALEDLRANPSK